MSSVNVDEIESLWNEHWRSYKLSWFFRYLWIDIKKEMKRVIQPFPKHYKILDFGCGVGRTMQIFKESNFKNVKGSDISPVCLNKCEKKGFNLGKDIFLVDKEKTPFDDDEFDVVFSDGLLEHYKDITHLVKEMCRISKNYVLLLQPNHTSFLGLLFHLFPNFKARIKEQKHPLSDYKKCFKKFNFKLVKVINIHFNQEFFLLFQKTINN